MHGIAQIVDEPKENKSDGKRNGKHFIQTDRKVTF